MNTKRAQFTFSSGSFNMLIHMFGRKLFLGCAVIITVINANTITAQNISILPQVGIYYQATNGINIIDSIVVNGGGNDGREFQAGISGIYKFNKRFSILLGVDYRHTITTHTLYNYKKQCLLCPVTKVQRLGIRNIIIQLMPQLNFPLGKRWTFSVFGGLSMNYNHVTPEEDIDFNGKHPDITPVFNRLDDSVSPITWAWMYGGSMEYNNIVFTTKMQHRSTYTKEIVIEEITYPYRNTWEFLTFSLGYRFEFNKKDQKSD